MKKILIIILFTAVIANAQWQAAGLRTDGKFRDVKNTETIFGRGIDSVYAALSYIVNLGDLQTSIDSLKKMIADSTISVSDASMLALLTTVSGKLDSLAAISARLKDLQPGTTNGNNTVTVGTSATQLPNIPLDGGTITVFTQGATVYIGGPGVTTSTGYPLQYLDDFSPGVANLNQLYAISTVAGTDLRYFIKRK